MYKSTYASTYKPAAGTKSDFEKLLAKFAEKGNVRFEEFSAIWREMKMPLIFAGRKDDQECREVIIVMRVTVKMFLDNLIIIISQNMIVLSCNTFPVTGVLYLLLCMYHGCKFNWLHK